MADSVLDGLPSRRLPFWAAATPQAIRGLQAAAFRRNAESAAFTADNDPSVGGSYADIAGGGGTDSGAPFRRGPRR